MTVFGRFGSYEAVRIQGGCAISRLERRKSHKEKVRKACKTDLPDNGQIRMSAKIYHVDKSYG